MFHDVRSFINLKRLETAEEVILGDGYSVEALRIGTIVRLSFPGRNYLKYRLYETLYVPKLSNNPLNVSKATKSGKSCVFTDSGCQIIDDKRIVTTSTKVGNIYHLKCIKKQKAAHTATSCLTMNTREQVWHRRFCPFGTKNLLKLSKEQQVAELDYNKTKYELL